jgi:hypothetical protein
MNPLGRLACSVSAVLLLPFALLLFLVLWLGLPSRKDT